MRVNTVIARIQAGKPPAQEVIADALERAVDPRKQAVLKDALAPAKPKRAKKSKSRKAKAKGYDGLSPEQRKVVNQACNEALDEIIEADAIAAERIDPDTGEPQHMTQRMKEYGRYKELLTDMREEAAKAVA